MEKLREYQICTNCIMDTTDSKIKFDESGVCDYCNSFKYDILPDWKPGNEKLEELNIIAKKIKEAGKGKKYDCILGLSGGVDSSYLAYIAKEKMGLRPLIYTVDTGWNLNVAVENIEKLVKKLDLDMYTEVVNWNEMKDLQLAFFKSQVPYQDLPQDHVIFAGLYNYAVKHGIKYVLTGSNIATEAVRPPIEWVHLNDLTLIKDIHKQYGSVKLKNMPMCGMFKYRLNYAYLRGMKRLAPLDYINYDKEKAEKELFDLYGWEKYANKHYENIFTRFYEGYYLPYKFGFDKRRAYFSNMILADQMSREEAIIKISENAYDKETMEADLEYIAKKLGITPESFKNIINGPNKKYSDYKNSLGIIESSIKVAKKLGVEKRNFR
ncbi:N-acetyl sugar amidotransferase [Planococcus glaciei]|uniref:N-acetyl sugar amidotransferase n=1 Tax=Planococcus glaciei TaxID=459472 RepID=UPI0008840139|nr:N-acetyl sugar amidotransferase [Planococcus glaciei]SDH87285.1 N-acetyl sugar amidotransferase [Planococcus glaciei]